MSYRTTVQDLLRRAADLRAQAKTCIDEALLVTDLDIFQKLIDLAAGYQRIAAYLDQEAERRKDGDLILVRRTGT
jgi:hypothetical protein